MREYRFEIILAVVALLALGGVLCYRHHRQAHLTPSTPAIQNEQHYNARLTVEQAQYRSANEFDTGTVQVLLRNPNDFPVRLTYRVERLPAADLQRQSRLAQDAAAQRGRAQ